MPTYELEPFVVVAPHPWQPGSELSPQRFHTAQPVDLAAILSAQLPAAALTRKGPLAGDIVLRGFSRDNVLITVDDNKTFCACPNRMDPPAFHVSSQQIEAVSVRTGPFRVDQGGSIGGSVAVRTTAPSDATFARVYAYGGSFDYFASGLTSGTSLSEGWSVLGGAYYQQGGVYTDGEGVRLTELPGTNYIPAYREVEAFQVFTAELKTAYSWGEAASLTLNYAYQDAQDVLYPGLRMDAPSDRMNRASIALRLPLSIPLADAIDLSLAYSNVDHDMRDTARTSLNNMGGAFVERGYFMRTQANSRYQGARLVLQKELGAEALLRYGVDFQRREWQADNLIGNQANPMLPDTRSDTLGAWIVYEQRGDQWAGELGLRVDTAQSRARADLSFVQQLLGTSTNARNDTLPSLYALFSRTFNDQVQAYVGVGMASRLPDPQERYLNLNRPMANPDWVGNPDLDPVHNLEIQGGVRWQQADWSASLSAFQAWLSDYIYLTQLEVTPGGATSYTNLDARIYGGSFDLGWQPQSSLRIETGLAWQEGVRNHPTTGTTNQVLGEVPPLRARLAVRGQWEDLFIQAEMQAQAPLDRIDPALGETPLDGWMVLNLAASYRCNEYLSLSGGVDNALDAQYAVANAFVRDPFRAGVIVPEPGRFWFVRVEAAF